MPWYTRPPESTMFKYLREVKIELSKVIWPKASEVIKLTALVLIVSLVVGIYVGALDFGFTKLLELALTK